MADTNIEKLPANDAQTTSSYIKRKRHPLRLDSIGVKPKSAWSNKGHRRSTVLLKDVKVFVNVPVSQVTKTGLNYETELFANATTFHGLIRMYQGKNWIVKLFWILIIVAAIIFFVVQCSNLMKFLIDKPTVSSITYTIPTNGLQFPMVTVCNNNPVKNSSVQKLNSTGDLKPDVLKYILSYIDQRIIDRIDNDSKIQQFHEAYINYTKNHPNFTVRNFFMNGGFECNEMLLECHFGGSPMNCCAQVKPVFTSMGKCYQFQPTGNMSRQYIPDDYYGLRIEGLVGKHEYLNEFSEFTTQSLRFFVHAPGVLPTITSAGITVTNDDTNIPTKVFTAVTAHHYNLLPRDQWGECRQSWSNDQQSAIYSQSSCQVKCLARQIHQQCNCTPLQYNIEDETVTCSPFELHRCTEKNPLLARNHQSEVVKLCSDCLMQCDRWVYNVENSYARGAFWGLLDKMAKRYHIKTSILYANLVSMNIYYREIAYINYEQEKATDLMRTISDIGGNMGLFIGASIVTIAEISVFIGKVVWVCISKQRRKKVNEKRLSSTPNSPGTPTLVNSSKGQVNQTFQDDTTTQKNEPQITLECKTRGENEPCVKMCLDLENYELYERKNDHSNLKRHSTPSLPPADP